MVGTCSLLTYNPKMEKKTMKKTLLTILLPLLLIVSAFGQSKKFDKVMLIQPNEVLTQRCPDVKEFSNYIKSVQDVIEPYNTGNKSLGNGYIVIALRPVAKSNVWFDLDEDKNLDALKKKILSVSPCHVQGGVVLIVLSNLDTPQERLPLPKEWEAVLKDKAEEVEVSALVDEIWPPEITKKEKDDILKLINNFKKEKNFSQSSLKKYSDIITYATESEMVHITVDSDCWPEEISDSEYGPMFLLAYICGNMEKQLVSGVYENSSDAGIQFELMKYDQLKKVDKKVSFEFFENMNK